MHVNGSLSRFPALLPTHAHKTLENVLRGGIATDIPQLHHAGTLLSLALVFWTGSSLFAMLHPRIVIGMAQEGAEDGETARTLIGRVRLQGALMSLAGFILLALPLLM